MSWQATSCVLEHSKSYGSARLVLLAIADHADRVSWEAWPSVKTIAREANYDQRTVQRALNELVKSGELERTIQGAPLGQIPLEKRPNLYQMRCPTAKCHPPTIEHSALENPSDGVTPVTQPGDTSVANRVTPTSPKPSLEPSKKQQADPSKRGAETQAEYEKASDVIARVVEIMVKSKSDWMDYPDQYRANQLKELERLRREIYRLLPLSGNSAPPGRLEMIADHLATIELGGRSGITWT